jgi:hypothetical protein
VKGFARNWAFMSGLALGLALMVGGQTYLHNHTPWYVSQPIGIAGIGLVYAVAMKWLGRRKRRG